MAPIVCTLTFFTNPIYAPTLVPGIASSLIHTSGSSNLLSSTPALHVDGNGGLVGKGNFSTELAT